MAQPFAAKVSEKSEMAAREMESSQAARFQSSGAPAIQIAGDAVKEFDAIGVGSCMRILKIKVDPIPEMRQALVTGVIDSYSQKPDQIAAAMRGLGDDPYAVAAEALALLFDFGLSARVRWVETNDMSLYNGCQGYFENDLYQTVFSLIGEVLFAGFRLIPTLGEDKPKFDVSAVRAALEVQQRLFAIRFLKKAPQWMLKPKSGMVSGMIVYAQRSKGSDVVGHTDMIDRAEALLGALVYKDLLDTLGQPGFIYGSTDAFQAALRRLGQKATGIL